MNGALLKVKNVRDNIDSLRFNAPGAVSGGIFSEDPRRHVLKRSIGAGKPKVFSLLIVRNFFHWLYQADSALSRCATTSCL